MLCCQADAVLSFSRDTSPVVERPADAVQSLASSDAEVSIGLLCWSSLVFFVVFTLVFLFPSGHCSGICVGPPVCVCVSLSLSLSLSLSVYQSLSLSYLCLHLEYT